MVAIPFGSVAVLEILWRPLAASEKPRAEYLLTVADAEIRRLVPDVESRFETTLIPGFVAASAVKRVMSKGTADGAEVTQETQTAGVFSHSQTFAADAGKLYITSAEVTRLRNESAKRQHAGSVDMLGGAS